MDKKLHLITAVVQRKLGEGVLDAALAAGASGATFFDAQGTGVRQRLGAIGSLIEGEKQVLFVVSDPEHSDAVLEALTKAGRLRDAGMGFAYVQEVEKAVGFVPVSQ
ncbi:MAG: P-II family nitrogen regulator [Elusimicrobiota bacterium]|jgi:nitrogen regulatory protein PII